MNEAEKRFRANPAGKELRLQRVKRKFEAATQKGRTLDEGKVPWARVALLVAAVMMIWIMRRS